MTDKTIDVLAIGNAIMDVLAEVPQDFPVQHGMQHGGFQLVDTARAATMTEAMMPHGYTLCAGGSAANSAVAMAQLGSSAAFIGKVRNDAIGGDFRRSITEAGVAFTTPSAVIGNHTARCVIAVTPDGARSMNTDLGIAGVLDPVDIDEAQVKSAKWLLAEGYLWDREATKDTIRHAMKLAKQHGTKMAFSLSAVFVVQQHRAEILAMLEAGQIDLILGNDEELEALFPGQSLDDALQALLAYGVMAAVTRGAAGAVVATPSEWVDISAEPIAALVDTTGAGDAWAAGFLHGLAHGQGLHASAELGAVCAAVIIQQLGARAKDGFPTVNQAA